MPVEHFAQIFEDLTRRANIKSYLTSKVDPILKLSNYKATTQIARVSAQKPNVHAGFQRYIPTFCTRVLRVHIEPLTNDVFSSFFFAGNLGFPKAQIYKKT